MTSGKEAALLCGQSVEPGHIHELTIISAQLWKGVEPLSLWELFGVEFCPLFGVLSRHYGRIVWAPGIGPEARAGSVPSAPASFRAEPAAAPGCNRSRYSLPNRATLGGAISAVRPRSAGTKTAR